MTATGSTMRLRVDTWDPSYGASTDDQAAIRQSRVDVALDVEMPMKSWRPVDPAPGVAAEPSVLFIDGVRRIDAIAWVDSSPDADGAPAMGLLASYAAGAVHCRADGARLAAATVHRGLFTGAEDAADLVTSAGTYAKVAVQINSSGSAPAQQLSEAVQSRMRALEADIATAARSESGLPGVSGESHGSTGHGLLVVDGPLRRGTRLPRTLGYAKTHATRYLPPEGNRLIGELRPGQRTPVFALLDSTERFSWYLKLPGGGQGWSGVVRVECASELAPADVIDLAAVSQATLSRYACAEYKDSRAPQNLHPIAGLERQLRRRLGDQGLLHRAIRSATH
ncbi:MAG TPA: hypothetical protein VFE65_19185 [Pseudonocardia sp.]|nr:hypothetical protein [Pseudonocardia sp.]